MIGTPDPGAHRTSCVSCRTVSGELHPPGGVVLGNSSWTVFLRERPLLVAGQGFIVLNRHCERLDELSDTELCALSRTMRDAEAVYREVLRPERMHFGLYAEGVRHLHVHILPRMPGMPVGNVPVTLLHTAAGLLARLRVRRPFADAEVADVAQRLRRAASRMGVGLASTG